jgi:hypothetical protein
LLALVALVLQPLIVSTECGTAFAHSHGEELATDHAHPESLSLHSHQDSHHHQHSGDHHGPAHGTPQAQPEHSDRKSVRKIVVQDAPQGMTVSPEHQHEVCCSYSDQPFVAAALPLRSLTHDNPSDTTPQAVVSSSLFRLDLLTGLPIRAGPSDSSYRSLILQSSLLGRAPPFSV